MPQTNHGSIEFLKFPDPQHPGDTTRMIKKWLRDSWARRKIVALQQAIAAIIVPTASTANPQMDGTAAPGVSTDYARGDHVHPSDTSKQAVLSAAQLAAVNSGVTAAKVQTWDDITVPTKTSDLTNDSGFITGYTETDPTVSAWAKAANKPAYTAAEVGALPDTTQIPSKTSDLTNDSGFITGYTETDPTVPTWAKQPSKPTYTASEVGALPDTTPIPIVPTNVSAFTNDAGYVTSAKINKSGADVITKSSGFSGANISSVMGKLQGDICQINATIGSGTYSAGANNVGTFTSEFRPSDSTCYGVCFFGGSSAVGTVGRFAISTAGVLTIYAPSAISNTVRFSAVFARSF